MVLTQSNILHYLLDKHFSEIESAVSGSFVVRSLTRRNLNFHVSSSTQAYLVKQAKGWDVQSRASLEREALFYRQAETDRRLAPLAPQCYAYDPPNSILILEFLSGHTDLYRVADRFEPALGRLCGETMGVLHREMESSNGDSNFQRTIPWGLPLHDLPEQDKDEPGGGRCEFTRVLKRHPEFARSLDALRAEWRPDTLTHGDWKLENCLISRDRTRLRVVDWEFAAWGDSIWDVAAQLQSCWNFWVRWPSKYPIETIQPALRAFLNAYAQSRGRDPVELAARAIRFAGARMLQSAFESLDKAEQMTGAAVRLLQGSFNILTRPEWAAEQLLGTPLRKLTASV
jgi:Ser/Thr protein kinase RdoA (MazF antagonist)